MEALDIMSSRKTSAQFYMIVGLGKSGESCVRYLLESGQQVMAVDSRENPPALAALRRDYPQLDIRLGPFKDSDFAGQKEIIVSPGVAMSTPALQLAQQNGAECYGDIELFVRFANAPIIAITGSNGKSTVVTMLAEMFNATGKRAIAAGNIGKPVVDILREGDASPPDYYVLELSSFQLETTHSLDAAVSLILNISPDHMDRYDSYEAYRTAKAGIYSGHGKIVVAVDEIELAGLLPPDRNTINFGETAKGENDIHIADCDGEACIFYRKQKLLSQRGLKVPGRHNLVNAAAALAVAVAVDVPVEPMAKALKQFKGLAHRLQFIIECNHIRWYNDSKGTNVGATVAAVEGLDRKVVLIAGGEGKDADFTKLAPVLKSNGRALVLIGQDANKIEQAVSGVVKTVHAVDLDDAVAKAAKMAEDGDAIMLSPACASFDMFRNYEDRGEKFITAVKQYVN